MEKGEENEEEEEERGSNICEENRDGNGHELEELCVSRQSVHARDGRHTAQLRRELVKCSENGGREDHVTEEWEENEKSLSRKGLRDAVDRIMRCEEERLSTMNRRR